MAKEMETMEENMGEDTSMEMTPEEKVSDFATVVADKAKMVASGELDVEAFVADLMTELEAMQAMMQAPEASRQ
jgi:hypothetical protein